MNKLEFKETINALGINEKALNISLKHEGNDYAIVEGKIPLEVAKIIYAKYEGSNLGIRIAGEVNNNPEECAVDDILVKDTEYKGDSSMKEYLSEYKDALKRFKRRQDKNKYIRMYHIDTMEGLVILINEICDYYLRRKGKSETEVVKFPYYMQDIYNNIIKSARLDITTDEWMNNGSKEGEIYSKTVMNNFKTSFSRSFRQALNTFDATINPFSNKYEELANPIEYINKARLHVIPRGDDLSNIESHIEDLSTGNVASFYRAKKRFSYSLSYELADQEYFSVIHYFSNSAADEEQNGEVIAVSYFGNKTYNKVDIRYNITKGTIGTTNGPKRPITPEEKEYIYDQLIRAISLTSEITINNMRKQENAKQLRLKQNN